MEQQQSSSGESSGGHRNYGNRKDDKKKKKDKSGSKKRIPMPSIGRRRKKFRKGVDLMTKLPKVLPNNKCRLKLLKLHRISDWLLMEEEFLQRSQINENSAKKDKKQKEAEKQTQKLFRQLRGPFMKVAELKEIISEERVIVSTDCVFEWYVPVMSFVDRDQLELNCNVLLNPRSLAVVGVIDDVDPKVSVMRVNRAPTESFADIGGLEVQIQELKESVELPLTHPELYEVIGIKPPKGVILYGPPGTGKTLLAKAVANSTSATFLHIVGSELIQKHLGDGPKLVRDVFKLAEELAPTIVFIDEIDAVGTKRYNSDSSGEREIQRTMLELLNQLDGFDTRSDVKIVMATNRIDTLDPALIRPGRIDRKIEVNLPNDKTKQRIFNIHSQRMSLSADVDFKLLINESDDLSGADIKAICTEAGLLALRERRKFVTAQDFTKAKGNVLYRKKEKHSETLYL